MNMKDAASDEEGGEPSGSKVMYLMFSSMIIIKYVSDPGVELNLVSHSNKLLLLRSRVCV